MQDEYVTRWAQAVRDEGPIADHPHIKDEPLTTNLINDLARIVLDPEGMHSHFDELANVTEVLSFILDFVCEDEDTLNGFGRYVANTFEDEVAVPTS